MKSPIPPNDITAVVLCGGEGRRMGGADKPLVLFHGRPLVQHVLEGLHGAVGDIVLIANRSLDIYRRLGPRVVSDIEPGRGPLGGIASAAPQVHTPWAFICAGDTPFISRVIVDRLAAHESPHPDAPRIAHDGVRCQPLVTLMPRVALTLAAAHLTSDSASVRAWLDAMRAVEVPLAEFADAMLSVDTPEMLVELAFRSSRTD